MNKIVNKLQYFRESTLAWTGSNLVKLNFGDVGFCRESRTGEPGDKPSKQCENQQQSQPRNDTEREIEPGPYCAFYALISSPIFPNSCGPFMSQGKLIFSGKQEALRHCVDDLEYNVRDHWSKSPLDTRYRLAFNKLDKDLSVSLDYITEHDLHSLLADSNRAFDLFSLLDSISDRRSIHAIANILNSE